MGRGGYQRKEDTSYFYFDPWCQVCLNCNLPICYRDNDRDDNPKKMLMKAKKLCPIEIGKKMKWTPERVLSELND